MLDRPGGRELDDLAQTASVVLVRVRHRNERRSRAVVGEQLLRVALSPGGTSIDDEPPVGRRSNDDQLADARTEQPDCERLVVNVR
jgi:hypothetical protein